MNEDIKMEVVDYRTTIKRQEKDKLEKLVKVKLVEAPDVLKEAVGKCFTEIKELINQQGIDFGININDVLHPDIYVAEDASNNLEEWHVAETKRTALIFNSKYLNVTNESLEKKDELIIKHELLHYFFNRLNKAIPTGDGNASTRTINGVNINIGKIEKENVSARELFAGLNEGSINLIAVMSTYNNIGEILQNEETFKKYMDSYVYETIMVYKILQILMTETKRSDILKIFFQALATGDPEFFHLIKQVYGGGAIKLLSEFKTDGKLDGGMANYSQHMMNEHIRNFFMMTNKDARNNRRREIMKDRGIKK